MVVALALTGCQMDNWGQKQTVGTGAGALAGGLLGAQVGGGSGSKWATGAGVLLGALIGSEIGASLDRADMAYAEQANTYAQTAEIGEPIRWNNPDSGNHGVVTATRDGYNSTSGAYCREYEQRIYVDGREEIGYGTACKQADGRWLFID
jgi:surface antigen